MSVIKGPNVVREGLVLHLDAGTTRSYPGSGTTWVDLTSNSFNGTLTNGPTFNSQNGGSIVFDGTNDYVALTPSFTGPPVTFLAWIRRNGNTQNNPGIIFDRQGSNTATGLEFRTEDFRLGYHWNDVPATYGFSSGLIVPNLTWCQVAVSITTNSAILYLNTSSATNTNIPTFYTHANKTFTSLRIGHDNLSGDARYLNGNVAIAMVYTRALSATEITQNYNALKARFGL